MISNGKESIGFIAQEVQSLLPDMVDDSEADNLKASTGPLMPRLVKAIQEQQSEIEELRQENYTFPYNSKGFCEPLKQMQK